MTPLASRVQLVVMRPICDTTMPHDEMMTIYHFIRMIILFSILFTCMFVYRWFELVGACPHLCPGYSVVVFPKARLGSHKDKEWDRSLREQIIMSDTVKIFNVDFCRSDFLSEFRGASFGPGPPSASCWWEGYDIALSIVRDARLITGGSSQRETYSCCRSTYR